MTKIPSFDMQSFAWMQPQICPVPVALSGCAMPTCWLGTARKRNCLPVLDRLLGRPFSFPPCTCPPLTKPTTSLRSLRERPRENGSRLIVDRSCNRPADHLRAFTPAPFCRLIFFTPCCACTHMGTRKHILRKNYCSKVWGCGSALKTSCAAG